MAERLKIFVGCEYSGVVRDAFISSGHWAESCDLLPTDSAGPHHQGDIFHYIHSSTFGIKDIMIMHPPCTYLCNSGVRWLFNKDGSKNLDRWEKMESAALFFKALLNSNCDKICIENPIMHKYALELIGKKYSQIVQPWQFGHSTSKATCLWLKGLPPPWLLQKLYRKKKEHRTFGSLRRGRIVGK